MNSDAKTATDRIAGALFVAAIREGRCGELYDCLTSGGSATIDRGTGALVMVDAETLQQFSGFSTTLDLPTGDGRPT